MKKFSFKLQKVIDVKESMEKKKMIELAEAEHQLSLERKKLEGLVTKIYDYKKEYDKKKKDGPITASEAGLFIRYIEKLTEDMRMQKQNIKIKEEQAKVKREELISVVKDKKILEKLKERKFTDYQRDALRKEQNFLDEISAIKVAREGIN